MRSQIYSWMHSWASSLARPAGEPGQDGVEHLVLGNALLERLLATEARRDLQRLAAVLAEAVEDALQECGVRDRLAHLQRGVPRGEQL